MATIKHIEAKNLYHLHTNNPLKIIDIRESFELKISKIDDALHIPMNNLIQNHKLLLKNNETYYILCHTGQRSLYTTNILTELGYDVINVKGGINQYPGMPKY